MGNLHRVVATGATAIGLFFGGLTTPPNLEHRRRKIDLCGYHHTNYFARLVPDMGLFSKICNRS